MTLKPLLSLATLLSLAACPALAETEVYRLSDKQFGDDAPWSGDGIKLRISPGKDGTIKFALPDLPEHQFVKLVLDIAIVKSGPSIQMRDDAPPAESKRRLKITTGDGRTLLDSSFSSNTGAQSFPDAFGAFSHAPGTGANKVAKNGIVQGIFNFRGTDDYTLELVFPHRAAELELSLAWEEDAAAAGGGAGGFAIKFKGIPLGGRVTGGDGPYSISELRVSTIGGPVELDATRANALLDVISGTDPLAAQEAARELVGAGDACLPAIRARFEKEIDPGLAKKLDALTAGLRSDDFKERSAAEIALADLGPATLPLLAKILSEPDALTIDVRIGLEKVRQRLEKSANSSPDQVLANRLRSALEIIGTADSKAVVSLLPALTKVARYDSTKGGGRQGGQPNGGGAFKLQFDPGAKKKLEAPKGKAK